jgi:hypothetical protein
MNKKGMGLESMYPAVLTIILIGIMLGVGIYVLDQVGEGVASDTMTIGNESITFDDGGHYVATYNACHARDFIMTILTNATGAETILASNYTFNTTGLLTTTTSNHNASTVNISYTYTGTGRVGSTDPCGVLATAETGTGGFADWIAVIVVVLAAAIVLGIVISSFGKRSAT